MRGLAIILVFAGCGGDAAEEDVRDAQCPAQSFLCGRPRNIAHRGGSDLAPENTVVAFQNAVAVGADVLEMDVRSTPEGELFLLHDVDVDRTTDGEGPYTDLSFEEIRALDAGYWFTPDDGASYPYRGAGVKVPTLAEVLEAVPDGYFMIEIKDAPRTVPLVLALLESLGMGDQVVIASIYDDILADVRAQAPEVLTSMGAAEMLALDNLTDETEADYATPAPFFQPPYDLLRDETLARARRHGLVVQVWTVNEREAMVGLLERGVDGIITDDPALLREVLASP